MQSLQELDLDDAEFVSRIRTTFRLEEIEFAGCRLSHLDDAAKGIFVLTSPLQADGHLIGLHSFLRLEMHIAKATGRLATPDEFSAGIDQISSMVVFSASLYVIQAVESRPSFFHSDSSLSS